MATTDLVNAALEKVGAIDLTPISRALQYENPALWDDATLADTEASYRRLLALHLLHPADVLVVNKALDDYWHAHILDTEKYAADCEAVFGRYLHHHPYFGMNGEAERQRQLEGFALTQQLWEESFGVPMVAPAPLTLDRALGSFDPQPRDAPRPGVYAFPQTCKCGQHCDKVVVPDQRINPQINPAVNPQTNPQIRNPVIPASIGPSIGGAPG